MARAPDPDRPICLIGLRCSGKSSVGRALAPELGRVFVDVDDEVLAAARRSKQYAAVGEVLVELGADAFRELEARYLAEVLERAGPLLVATGGGVVESAAGRALLERATCVWLRAPVSVLTVRLRADSTPRPSLTGGDPATEMAAVAARRESLYASAANLEVDASADGVDAVVARVRSALGGLR